MSPSCEYPGGRFCEFPLKGLLRVLTEHIHHAPPERQVLSWLFKNIAFYIEQEALKGVAGFFNSLRACFWQLILTLKVVGWCYSGLNHSLGQILMSPLRPGCSFGAQLKQISLSEPVYGKGRRSRKIRNTSPKWNGTKYRQQKGSKYFSRWPVSEVLYSTSPSWVH